MSTSFNKASLIANSSQSVTISQQLNSAAAGSSSYLVLNAYDRNEYAVGSSGATGSFTGGGNTLGFSALSGDARGAGIVFTLAATSGRYYNSKFGFLDQLVYTASSSRADVTDLSLFGTNNVSLANTYAINAISLAQHDAAGYLGTLTVATVPGFTGTAPSQATPFSIAAVAQTFVGAVCSKDGCWVLASTIAAEAGASLPVQSAVNMAGAANGEWCVAYNGPAGSTGDWASSVRTGDVVGFVTAAGIGHITTCVSGAGTTARVIDNVAVLDASGTLLNGANDGSANDIVVQAAHAASQEWAGVSANTVVIFRLDTPVVTTSMATLNVTAGGTANLADVFAATDPAGKSVTSYQAYTATSEDRLSIGGTSTVATSASTAVTASSLSQIDFDRGASDVPDTVTVRAFNGAYWGDWTTISTGINPVTVSKGTGLGSTLAAGSGEIAIHRFFDKNDGTHFFTASGAEASNLVGTRTDLSYEGVGLHGYADASASTSSEAVFRFFNVADGTHFYTASTTERDAILTKPDAMKFEGIAFYENATPQAGDSAVYRFFDTSHGTHLFTQSSSERANIIATRPDLVSEGISFYAPN